MAHSKRIRAALDEIPDSTEVVLSLRDGSELRGVLQSGPDGQQRLMADGRRESVAIGQVADVVLEGISPGPE